MGQDVQHIQWLLADLFQQKILQRHIPKSETHQFSTSLS